MENVNRFINRYFGVILLTGAVLGLFMPFREADTSQVIILALGIVIFTSFFRISLDQELFRADWKRLPVFFVLRFMVLPVLAYLFFNMFSSFYAISFFLLLLLPAAVSSPAFSAMFGGSVSLALKILVFSSFISILSIPLLSSMMLTHNIQIDGKQMFLIMVYTVAVPFAAHLPLRRSGKISGFFRSNIPVITALGLMVIFVVSTSRNKAIILEEPGKMLIYAGISAVFYLVLYLVGYFLAAGQEKPRRIAYSVSSGANNIGIGVTLTMLFFPGEINVFFIVSQLSWIFVLIPMRTLYDRLN